MSTDQYLMDKEIEQEGNHDQQPTRNQKREMMFRNS
jgi:hypothetical protein